MNMTPAFNVLSGALSDADWCATHGPSRRLWVRGHYHWE